MSKKRLVVTDELREAVRAARANKMRLNDIAAKFKIAKSTVERIVKGPAPSEYGRKSGVELLRSSDPELKDIQDRIAELRERAKAIVRNSTKRIALKAYVEKNELTRADVSWLYRQLPLTRITRKHREARLKAKGAT